MAFFSQIEAVLVRGSIGMTMIMTMMMMIYLTCDW